jgi:hypothetical protein
MQAGDEGPAIVHLDHEALALERRQRFAHRRLADPELLGDPRFHDALARQQFAAKDRIAKHLDNAISLR